MPNLYGVANSPGLPQVYNTMNGADVVCTHDIDNVWWTSPALIAPSAGYFYAMVWASVVIAFGASVPSGSNFKIAIGAGSATNPLSLAGGAFVANTNVNFTFCNATPASQVAWQGPGSTISLFANPGVNNFTIRAFASGVAVLLRAPDQ